MKNTISKSDFTFQYAGHGHYLVQYTSPKTGKSWVIKTDNMPLIDNTKNNEYPTKKSLNELKRLCKTGIINSFIL